MMHSDGAVYAATVHAAAVPVAAVPASVLVQQPLTYKYNDVQMSTEALVHNRYL